MTFGVPVTLTAALISLALGYLLGSVPFGLLISHLAGAGDVRKIGSGNIGATNVLRTGKKWAAAATLLCDGGKGAVAVLVAGALFGPGGSYVAGLAAMFGHIFPVWLKFKGGKGVATALGVTLAVFWPAGLAMVATWLGVAYISKISSLSALAAAVLTPAYAILFGDLSCALMGLVIAFVILATHHENIHRLLNGTEPRIGKKKETASI